MYKNLINPYSYPYTIQNDLTVVFQLGDNSTTTDPYKVIYTTIAKNLSTTTEQTIYYPSSYFQKDTKTGLITINIPFNGKIVSTYKYLPKTTLPPEISYIHSNYQNTPAILTNTQSKVVQTITKSEWGSTLQNNLNQEEQLPTTLGYTGHKESNTNNLIYAHQRYLNSESKVWLSHDPFSLESFSSDAWLNNPQQQNSYSYTSNNPVNRIDPDGRFDIKTGKIEKGDTLTKITSQLNSSYGINLSVNQVAQSNNIQNQNKISIGNFITLPKASLELRFNNAAQSLYVMDKTYNITYPDLKWSGVSGGTILNFEPIKKGKWKTVSTESIQYWDTLPNWNKILSTSAEYTKYVGLRRGGFPGGINSWGIQRTELIKDGESKPSGYYIHGGTSRGSAGCIDLTGQNDSFHNWFRSNGTALDLIVE